MYKCVSEGINNAWFCSSVSYYDTRNTSFLALEVSLIRSTCSERCFVYRGQVVWNSIPHDVRTSCYDNFKIKRVFASIK